MTSINTQRRLTISRGDTPMEVSEGLLVIPKDYGDIVIGVNRMFTTPLYWSLPGVYLGDRVTSYNGYLRFTTTCNGIVKKAAIVHDPLVQLQAANKAIVLEHFPKKLSTSGRYEVKLNEGELISRIFHEFFTNFTNFQQIGLQKAPDNQSVEDYS